jgi:translation initiation factor IF-1
MSNIEIEEYSEKSWKVFGDTKSKKERLAHLKGKYNRNLEGGPGWIFSKRSYPDSEELLEKILSTDSNSEDKSVPPKASTKTFRRKIISYNNILVPKIGQEVTYLDKDGKEVSFKVEEKVGDDHFKVISKDGSTSDMVLLKGKYVILNNFGKEVKIKD